MTLPPPNQIGLPAKFTEWRNGQDAAVLEILDSTKRFVTQAAPTGFGKSPVYVAAGLLSGGRVAFVVSRKGLQTQLVRDFGECGLVDIRGQGNYDCLALLPGGEFYDRGIQTGTRCDSGPCHTGARCSLRYDGCAFFDALALAKRSKLVVTNYPFWVAQHRYGDGIGRFDMVVFDEAHEAPDELASALEIGISDYEIESLIGRALLKSEDVELWRRWAGEVSRRIAERLKELLPWDRLSGRSTLREIQSLRRAEQKLDVIAGLSGDWIIERASHNARLGPVWPGPYAERFLFLNIPKVVLVSATIRPKTLELLGVDRDHYDFREYPSTFPVARRPVVFVQSVRCNHRWTDLDQRTWVQRIDQIISRRLDRKGIIHTHSYQRQELILRLSEHRAIMMFNSGADTEAVVARFRAAPPPAVLVSPSLSTGWDLPEDECEYCIIGKIPFLDTRSRIVAARTAEDEHYSAYVAMLTIVQSAGRGMRSEDDQCEILVVDDNWRWFYFQHREFAPKWFQQAVVRRRAATIPDPLPKLKILKGVSNGR